jgi:phage tail protein X
VIFIIFVVMGIFFVQIPSLHKDSSATHAPTLHKSAEIVEQRPPYVPPPPNKDSLPPPKEPVSAERNHHNTVKEVQTGTAALTNEAPKKSPEEGESRYVTVRDGDTFEKVLLKAYGQYDNALIALVLEANPNIANINTIFVGQRIRLPKP